MGALLFFFETKEAKSPLSCIVKKVGERHSGGTFALIFLSWILARCRTQKKVPLALFFLRQLRAPRGAKILHQKFRANVSPEPRHGRVN